MNRYARKIIATVVAAYAYSSLAVAQHQHAPVPAVATPPVTTAPTGAPVGTAGNVPRPVSASITTYRRFDAAEPMADWRAANKTVQEVGGWRAYAKEAAEEATKEAAKEVANTNRAAAPAGATK